MPDTPIHALPYPAQSDPPNVPQWMQALAARLDGLLPNRRSATGNTPTNFPNSAPWYADIVHGQSWVPIGGMASYLSDDADPDRSVTVLVVKDSWNATRFRVRAFEPSGDHFTGQVNVQWLIWGTPG